MSRNPKSRIRRSAVRRHRSPRPRRAPERPDARPRTRSAILANRRRSICRLAALRRSRCQALQRRSRPCDTRQCPGPCFDLSATYCRSSGGPRRPRCPCAGRIEPLGWSSPACKLETCYRRPRPMLWRWYNDPRSRGDLLRPIWLGDVVSRASFEDLQHRSLGHATVFRRRINTDCLNTSLPTRHFKENTRARPRDNRCRTIHLDVSRRFFRLQREADSSRSAARGSLRYHELLDRRGTDRSGMATSCLFRSGWPLRRDLCRCAISSSRPRTARKKQVGSGLSASPTIGEVTVFSAR